ncbi:MAG: regulatory protein RecX [Nevskiales bacterium]|nr:regulatory protein RecX [Nevskiales bacterium]
MRRPPNKDLSAEGARNTALRVLARREHSAAQLGAKLRQRGHDEHTVRQTLEQLDGAGWLSDQRYTEMLVRNRVAQGYGPLRIRADLQAAGVSDALAREALDAAEVDWLERAAAAHARRFEGPATTAKQWQQQYRFLAGRGFESGQIRSILKGCAEYD